MRKTLVDELWTCATAVAGTIPGPLLMGVVFDESCTLWAADCGRRRGSCMFYDNAHLSLGFLALGVAVAGVSLATMLAAVACYRAPTAADALVVSVNGKDSTAAEMKRRILYQTDF